MTVRVPVQLIARMTVKILVHPNAVVVVLAVALRAVPKRAQEPVREDVQRVVQVHVQVHALGAPAVVQVHVRVVVRLAAGPRVRIHVLEAVQAVVAMVHAQVVAQELATQLVQVLAEWVVPVVVQVHAVETVQLTARVHVPAVQFGKSLKIIFCLITLYFLILKNIGNISKWKIQQGAFLKPPRNGKVD